MYEARITSNVFGSERMAIVTDAVIEKTSDEINAVQLDEKHTLGDVEPGFMIYTAGYNAIKQKALDGSWADVLKEAE